MSDSPFTLSDILAEDRDGHATRQLVGLVFELGEEVVAAGGRDIDIEFDLATIARTTDHPGISELERTVAAALLGAIHTAAIPTPIEGLLN